MTTKWIQPSVSSNELFDALDVSSLAASIDMTYEHNEQLYSMGGVLYFYILIYFTFRVSEIWTLGI